MASILPEQPTTNPPRRASPGRKALFRLVAVLLALVPFVAAELLFVALGWGRPEEHDDPFVGFSGVNPLFVLSADGERYEVSRSRRRCFRPDWFAAEKGPDEFRIFCLGGSTVQGRPYGIETAFSTWLELSLQLAEPDRRWRVVNCGGVSYASYRLVPILKEVLGHGADLVILYTGHNEFLEAREYGGFRDTPGWLAGPWQLAARTRTFHVVREAYLRLRGTSLADAEGRTVLKSDVQAILDYEGGLEKYHRDEQWTFGVIEHFRFNVRRMVRMCKEAGVPILLVNPVTNLRDCPPFKSQNRDGLTDARRTEWNALLRQSADATGTPEAVELLGRALAIDNQHAGVHYRLAKELDRLGRIAEARTEYLRAKELDICPLRILEPMNEEILTIAREEGVPLVDAREAIAQASRDGIPGDDLLADHVHPRITGHRLIADVLLDELAAQGMVHPSPGWKDEQEQRFQAHLALLGGEYFAQGIRRLEALQGWAAGRATLKPGEEDQEIK